MTGNRVQAVAIFLSLWFLFILLNCAEVTPPPGGEEDKVPPTILRSSPLNGSLNVERNNEITFWFTEGINKPASSKPVFISPRQTIPPKLRWKSDRLVIELNIAFDSNQTYVVTLTSEITDWRRNKMDSTVTIAFSTGDKIDSGSISGFVLSQGKPKSGILVGLYNNPSETGTVNYDSVYPNYISQSAADGSFRFRFLPKRKFRMVAFDDVNRNELYNPNEEPFAVPDRPIDFESQLPLDKLYLEMSPPVVIEPAIVSAFVTGDALIRIRLNTSIDLHYLKNNPNLISIKPIKNPDKPLTAKSFLESYMDTSSVLTVYAGKIDSGTYNVSVQLDTIGTLVSFPNLIAPEIKDKTLPSIVMSFPEDKAHFKNKISMTAIFSEPVDKSKLTSGTFNLTYEDSMTLSVTPNWVNDFQISFQHGELTEGKRYTMKIAEFEIADLSGNLMGDSISSFSFSVLNTDSLGSISGTASSQLPGKANSQRILTFSQVSGKNSFEFIIPSDKFNFELPAGKYFLSGYLDSNNNGKRELGLTNPYTFSESFGALKDTITVRARFETAGIEFEIK